MACICAPGIDRQERRLTRPWVPCTSIQAPLRRRKTNLQRLGVAGSQAARAGARAFGAKPREEERAARKRTFAEACASSAAGHQLAVRPESVEVAVMASASSPLLCDMFSELAILKRDLRASRSVDLARAKALVAAPNRYFESRGKEVVARAAAAVSQECLQSRASYFHSQPLQPHAQQSLH